MEPEQLSFFRPPLFPPLRHYDELRRLPKIDLHRHLLGAVSFETFVNLAHEVKIDLPYEDDLELRRYMTFCSPVNGLEEFFRPWKYLSRLQTNPEIVYRLGRDAIFQASLDNVIYLELRVSWGLTGRESFSVLDYLAALSSASVDGEREWGVITRVVLGLTRHIFDRHTKEHRDRLWGRIIQAAHRYREKLVVGFDVSGLETGYPASAFRDYLNEAKLEGFGLTVHAGETTDAEYMWKVLKELEPQRLGHGLAASQDPTLRNHLRTTGIPLEVCPTVNVLTSTVESLYKHPVGIFLSEGMPIVVGTDNPARCETSLSRELSYVASAFDLSLGQMIELNRNSINHTFATKELRARLLQLVQEK